MLSVTADPSLHPGSVAPTETPVPPAGGLSSLGGHGQSVLGLNSALSALFLDYLFSVWYRVSLSVPICLASLAVSGRSLSSHLAVFRVAVLCCAVSKCLS